MKKNVLILILILIGSSFGVLGQIREINRGEFVSQLQISSRKGFKFSRREKMNLNTYSKGIITETDEESDELLMPDKQRYVSVKKSDGKTERLELIKIGDIYYQKKNNDNWTQEKQWNQPLLLLGLPDAIKSSYTVEQMTINNNPVQLYKFYALSNETSPEEGEEKQTYWEQKYWIDKDGLIIRQEMTMGKPQSKEILSNRIFEYEYNPKDLKIEAPIKP